MNALIILISDQHKGIKYVVKNSEIIFTPEKHDLKLKSLKFPVRNREKC